MRIILSDPAAAVPTETACSRIVPEFCRPNATAENAALFGLRDKAALLGHASRGAMDRPSTTRDIGGGRFPCQCERAAITRSLGSAAGFRHCQAAADCGECPPLPRTRSVAQPTQARIPDDLPANLIPRRWSLRPWNPPALVPLLAPLAPRCLMAPLPAALGPGRAAADPVIARVNGVDIHQSDLALAEEEIGSNMPNMPPEQKRDYLITYLIDMILLSQAAETEKVADRPDFKHRLAFARNRLLMEACCRTQAKAAMTDEADAEGL